MSHNKEDYYKRFVQVLEKINNSQILTTNSFRMMLTNSPFFFNNNLINDISLRNFFNAVQNYANSNQVFILNDLISNTPHGCFMSEYLYHMLIDTSFSPNLWVRYGSV